MCDWDPHFVVSEIVFSSPELILAAGMGSNSFFPKLIEFTTSMPL